MEQEEFSPVIDRKKKKKDEAQSAQFSTEQGDQKVIVARKAKQKVSANDPQIEVNDTASAHAQTENQQKISTSPEKKKEVKLKHGFKPFAFFAGVFDIALAVTIVGLGIWTCMSIFNSVDTGITQELDHLLGMLYLPLLIFIFAVTAVVGILFLVSGIFSLIASFKSDRRNLNGLLVTATVFDAILLVFSVLLLASSDDGSRTLTVVYVVVLSVALVFKILDIILTKRRLKKYQTAKQEEYKETYHGPNFDNLNSVNQNSTETSTKENSNDAVDFSKLGK